uniref:Uncharacterized protein n=1 Tax=Timema shepardi TaxID=629360 RepID=A0A7R9B3U1_TIMSH|nr:unnamed protein product [Timema shepardi]
MLLSAQITPPRSSGDSTCFHFALQNTARILFLWHHQHFPTSLPDLVGFLFHACLLLVLLVWKPSGDDPALFYVISAAWGVCNAIWETLNFTLLLNLYPDSWQAPLTHCYFFRCLGLAVAFGLHGEMCSFIKLYSLAGALVLAVAPYTWLEVKMDSRLRRNSNMATL